MGKLPALAKDGLHYDYNAIRSYNRIINFLIGARGCGKGYGFQEWCIRDFIQNDKQFVYMRRFKQELNKTKKREFFDEKLVEKYHNYNIGYSDKFNAFIIGDGTKTGDICGYPYILSSSGQTKSGKEYQRVNKCAFDEFIIDKQMYHYLPDEVGAFEEATVSISRDRFCQFFLISNAMTWNNPYFIKFKIPFPEDDNIVATDAYALHKPSLKAYAEYMRNTPLGKAWSQLDPEYASYAYDNAMLRDSSDFIASRPKKSYFLFTFILNGHPVGVWIDDYGVNLYCSEKYDPQSRFTFVAKTTDHREKTLLLTRNNPTLKSFAKRCMESCVYFENQTIKSLVYDFIIKTI